MKLHHAIAKAIRQYPLLYRDTDYERSKIKVLDHLFLTIGNGYDWYDGYLWEKKSHYDSATAEYVLCVPTPYGSQRFSPLAFPDNYWAKKLSPEEDKAAMEALATKLLHLTKNKKNPKDKLNCIRRFKDVSLEQSTYDWYPYPISKHSALMTIPDNIRNDWLAGAEEICRRTFEFYTKPELYANDSTFKEIGKKYNKYSNDGKIIATPTWTKKDWERIRKERLTMLAKAMRQIQKIKKTRGLTNSVPNLH